MVDMRVRPGEEELLMQQSFVEMVLTYVTEHVWDIAFSLIALVCGALLQVVGDRLTRGKGDW